MPPSRPALLFLFTASLTPLCAAQNYVVSPLQYGRYEAAASSDAPFGGIWRYQQIHADLKGRARTLTGLAWRRDGVVENTASFVGRTLEMDVSCGNGNYSTLSTTFASSYVGTPVVVFTRKNVSGPDLSAFPGVTPAPWSFRIVFDTPFAYAGTNDLVFDIRIYSNTSANPYPFDAATGRDTSIFGALYSVGLGCPTLRGHMTLRSTFLTNIGANQLSATWSISNGPTSPTAVLLVGATNPNVFVPNLCNGNYVHTDLRFFTVVGSIDGLGNWNPATITVPWNVNLAGALLTAQVAATDPAQGGLGFAVSNGITSEIAPPPLPFQVARVIAGAATATTGSLLTGYGLITRFQY